VKTKIFLSKPNEGWKEVNVPDNFRHYSYDALISVMHRFIDLSQYKGILVTQNPDPWNEMSEYLGHKCKSA
jgi:hypothetical protein